MSKPDAKSNANRPYLGIFALSMINVSAIISLRHLPLMASHGLSSLFFFGAACLLFFIPCALVCAELATAWPHRGGIYAWAKEAFGEKAGFLAVWLEWIESVVWLPSVLSFVAATIVYAFEGLFNISTDLETNKAFLLGCMLLVLWGLTFINFKGIETSSFVSATGVILGTLFPGALMIGLGLAWWLSGKPLAMPIAPEHLLPHFEFQSVVFFTGVLLSFGGMEMASFHAQNAKNPQKSYPRAILLATVIIMVVSVLGSLAIACVLPKEEISLVSGLMQAFEAFFGAAGFDNWTRWIAILSVIGALALLNTWIIGPCRGLLVSAEKGDLPKLFARTNQNGIPVPLLIAQACVASLLAGVFLIFESVNQSYWLLSVMAAQLILLMYIAVFISAIKLRYTQPDTPRAYKIPGGKVGIWLVAGTGVVISFLTILLGFVPPEQFHVTHPWKHALVQACGIAIFIVAPYLMPNTHISLWKKKG